MLLLTNLDLYHVGLWPEKSQNNNEWISRYT